MVFVVIFVTIQHWMLNSYYIFSDFRSQDERSIIPDVGFKVF